MAPDPSADIALVICSDRGLFWQGAFLLSRAAMLDPGQRMDLYYYVTEPMPAPLRAALPARVKVVHWEGELPSASYGMPAHLTRAALLRIFAIDALAAQYPRVLYTDIDVFQRWGNLADLADLPAFAEPLAAVRDRALWGPVPERWVARNYLPRFAEPVRTRYFNSGMLLANGPAWRAEEISPRAMAFLAAHPEVCHYGDQSALNATLAGRWLELSPGWNWQANMRYDFLIPTRNPRLVHFTGPIKPWADKWHRFDELYAAAMRDWLQMHGLRAELEAMTARGFRASMERRRTVEFTRLGWDPLAMREAVKPYLNRRDFGDVVAGIPGYGWIDDRQAARGAAEDAREDTAG